MKASIWTPEIASTLIVISEDTVNRLRSEYIQGGYTMVGTVDLPYDSDLDFVEACFDFTNTDPAWGKRPISSGDIIRLAGGTAYLCKSIGWARVT